MKFPGWSDEMMENWWSLMNPQKPSQANDFMQQAFDMGKAYQASAESMFTATDDKANPLEDWISMLEKNFTAFTKPPEQMQAAADLAEKYRLAMTAYMNAFSAQGLDSVQALRERLEKMAKEGASIDSLRELYDLWIDISEEVYNKFAMSQQCQEIYGDLINTSTALKGEIDTMLASQLKSVNMPSQKDLDEAVKALHEKNRENASLREQLDSLNDKVKNLEAALAEKTPAPKATSKPAPKTGATPKAKTPVANAASKPVPKAKAAPKAKASPQKAPKTKPVKLTPDDLTKIKGIGPKMNEKLLDAGIQTFDQLAALSGTELEALEKKLLSQGRASRDGWVGQAASLAGTHLA